MFTIRCARLSRILQASLGCTANNQYTLYDTSCYIIYRHGSLDCTCWLNSTSQPYFYNTDRYIIDPLHVTSQVTCHFKKSAILEDHLHNYDRVWRDRKKSLSSSWHTHFATFDLYFIPVIKIRNFSSSCSGVHSNYNHLFAGTPSCVGNVRIFNDKFVNCL